MRTQVVIVGAGPAGSLLSHLLWGVGVENVVLERRSRDYVLTRIRAGVLEDGTRQALIDAGLGDRMLREGHVHDGVALAFAGERLRIDLAGLTGRSVTIYGQTEVQHDLYDAAAERDAIVFEAEDVALDGIDGAPSASWTVGGVRQTASCDWVVGCDGSRGVSRAAIPSSVLRTYERVYPFGWLGVLSRTPPVSAELIYANAERGFALCSMRNEMLSRYYVQCPLDTDLDEWSDDRFWDELAARLPADVADALVTGPSVEKSIAPLRSFVAEPMRHGRLLLAGDAAHIVPPTGAKGLNLAVGDVVHLARAIADHYAGSDAGVDEYSDAALRRVWAAVRFSWWMTTALHRFPEDDGGFAQRVQQAELDHLRTSRAAQTAFAEGYVGERG